MKNRNGYVLVYKPDHHRAEKNGLVYEHVLVAERMLGRNLNDNEVVHHKDHNRSNNNPDNLIIFATLSDHAAFHGGRCIYLDNGVWRAVYPNITKICPTCKKEFTLNQKDYAQRQKFCCVECAQQACSKTKLSIDELQQLLFANNGNFTKVAKLLNVSSNAIVHRLKRKSLPFHSKDYK